MCSSFMCREESPIFERSEKTGTPHFISNKNYLELGCCVVWSLLFLSEAKKTGTPHFIKIYLQAKDEPQYEIIYLPFRVVFGL